MYKLAKAEEQKAHLNELRKKSCWETVAPASYTERQNNTFIHWKDSFEAHYTKKAGLYNNEITFTLEDNMLKRLTVDSAGYVFCGKSNMKQIRRHINENAFITYKCITITFQRIPLQLWSNYSNDNLHLYSYFNA